MPCAYIFINTEKGFEKGILNELRKSPDIKEAYLTSGVYDIVVKINACSMNKLREILVRKIRLQDKVISTLTMMIIERKHDNAYPKRKSIKVHSNPIATIEATHAP